MFEFCAPHELLIVVPRITVIMIMATCRVPNYRIQVSGDTVKPQVESSHLKAAFAIPIFREREWPRF